MKYKVGDVIKVVSKEKWIKNSTIKNLYPLLNLERGIEANPNSWVRSLNKYGVVLECISNRNRRYRIYFSEFNTDYVFYEEELESLLEMMLNSFDEKM